MKRTEKIKTHFKNNKQTYLACTVVAFMAVVGTTKVSGGSSSINQALSWKPRATIIPTTINLIERSTPSKPVHLVGTNLYYNSLNEAARETGHHLSQLSKHVNGQLADLNGDVFEVLEHAA